MNKGNNEVRTLLVVGIMAAVFGLICYTPLGFLWGIVTFAGLGMIEGLLNQQINFLLWTLLCYLLTVELLWVMLLKKPSSTIPDKSEIATN